MHSRVEGMIQDVENEYGVEIETNDIPDLLCDGDNCRHSECDCWDEMKHELEAIAKEMVHHDCKEHPCAECTADAIDREMDKVDQEEYERRTA